MSAKMNSKNQALTIPAPSPVDLETLSPAGSTSDSANTSDSELGEVNLNEMSQTSLHLPGCHWLDPSYTDMTFDHCLHQHQTSISDSALSTFTPDSILGGDMFSEPTTITITAMTEYERRKAKRRNQNREAQRTFRERRSQMLRNLESELEVWRVRYENLKQLHDDQAEQVEHLRQQIALLGGSMSNAAPFTMEAMCNHHIPCMCNVAPFWT